MAANKFLDSSKTVVLTLVIFFFFGYISENPKSEGGEKLGVHNSWDFKTYVSNKLGSCSHSFFPV